MGPTGPRLTRADLLEILGITGFIPRPVPPAPVPEGPLTRPYDSRQRAERGWAPLTEQQIVTLNNRWGPGHNYNNVDGREWSPDREYKFGRGRKTYRRRVARRKTKKQI
jgi:hypothetical protein